MIVLLVGRFFLFLQLIKVYKGNIPCTIEPENRHRNYYEDTKPKISPEKLHPAVGAEHEWRDSPCSQ